MMRPTLEMDRAELIILARKQAAALGRAYDRGDAGWAATFAKSLRDTTRQIGRIERDLWEVE